MSELVKQRTSSGSRKVSRATQSPGPGVKSSDTSHESAGSVSSAHSPAATPAAAVAPATFWDKWKSRTEFTFIMIGLFVALLYTGHLALIGFIFCLHIWIFLELISLRDQHLFTKVKEVARKRVAVVDWLLFTGTVFFIYGRLAISRFDLHYSPYPFLVTFAERHAFVTLCFYITAFLVFVWSLEQRLYKFQFVQLCWTLLILHFTVFQSSFYLNLIFDGLIWFFIPTMMVVGNDIFAFVFGYFFGRTPLIQLSPRKTWEGFAGGMAMTLFFAVLFSSYLSSYPWMICPKTDLFTWSVQCTPAPAFQWATYQVSPFFARILALFGGSGVIHYMPIQVHAVVFALFASLIAPFGGFFASGFKRAIKIKDFGNTIPGHGGITDRMDCQMLMGVFAYVYCITFVHPAGPASLLRSLMALPVAQQQNIYRELHRHLADLKQLPA